jgi:hypothetical protein
MRCAACVSRPPDPVVHENLTRTPHTYCVGTNLAHIESINPQEKSPKDMDSFDLPPLDSQRSADLRPDGLPISRLARRIREEHRLMSDSGSREDYRPAGTSQAIPKRLSFKLAVTALVVCAAVVAWKSVP